MCYITMHVIYASKAAGARELASHELVSHELVSHELVSHELVTHRRRVMHSPYARDLRAWFAYADVCWRMLCLC